jgi:hypothetical protein
VEAVVSLVNDVEGLDAPVATTLVDDVRGLALKLPLVALGTKWIQKRKCGRSCWPEAADPGCWPEAADPDLFFSFSALLSLIFVPESSPLPPTVFFYIDMNMISHTIT